MLVWILNEGEKKDLKVNTQSEGTPITSTSAPASTLKSIGTFIVPPHPSITTTTTGIVLVSREFLQIIVDS